MDFVSWDRQFAFFCQNICTIDFFVVILHAFSAELNKKLKNIRLCQKLNRK